MTGSCNLFIIFEINPEQGIDLKISVLEWVRAKRHPRAALPVASRAGAIRRANRAGADTRPRPHAIRAKQGPPPGGTGRREERNETSAEGKAHAEDGVAGKPENRPGAAVRNDTIMLGPATGYEPCA